VQYEECVKIKLVKSRVSDTYRNNFEQRRNEKMSLWCAKSDRQMFSYKLYWKWFFR